MKEGTTGHLPSHDGDNDRHGLYATKAPHTDNPCQHDAVQVTLQFHPDWPFGAGTVLESIVRDGAYRSQFVTGTSNGGLTAHVDGDRWRWESRLFAGRYDHGPAEDRPVYGALNPTGDPYGGSVRFGSAHFRLRPEVTSRCTFCFPDSTFEPKRIVGPEAVDPLIEESQESELDPLDRYVEAHVHGGVVISRDVEALVLDPCFAGSVVEQAARALGCRIEWHPGFVVSPWAIDPDYRGRQYVELAGALGEGLTPAVIGQAARSGAHDLQSLKRVWHCLARFGRQTPVP